MLIRNQYSSHVGRLPITVASGATYSDAVMREAFMYTTIQAPVLCSVQVSLKDAPNEETEDDWVTITTTSAKLHTIVGCYRYVRIKCDAAVSADTDILVLSYTDA